MRVTLGLLAVIMIAGCTTVNVCPMTVDQRKPELPAAPMLPINIECNIAVDAKAALPILELQ